METVKKRTVRAVLFLLLHFEFTQNFFLPAQAMPVTDRMALTVRDVKTNADEAAVDARTLLVRPDLTCAFLPSR